MYNDKWVFFSNLPGKPALTGEEVKYWLKILNKVLKVGVEFEFNLQDAKGFCKGASESCPCVNMNDQHDCWKVCLNAADCKVIFGENFKIKCFQHLCSGFKSACATCKNFKVNCVDCKYMYDPSNDPDNIRRYLRDCLEPSKSYGNLSSTGVHSVVCDGSLLGEGSEGKGAEIITVGRRIDYWEFFNMLDNIIKTSIKKGAYVNERCSTHVHILTSYYDAQENNSKYRELNELERPLPQIVMANFHQLCRRYQNALTWMSMGLDKPNRLTRWEKYRVSVLDTSPVSLSMSEIINRLSEISNKPGGKYAWVNYMYSKFNKNRDVNRFHVEMRVLDGMMSASVVTAMCCLFHAMIIKAVEISKYGLLELGSKEWFDQTKEIKSVLLNNTSAFNDTNRFSDTKFLNEDYQHILKVESLDLLNQVKHILMRTGPAFDVLEKLIQRPVAYLRCDGLSWEDIEEHFAIYRAPETILEQKIDEIIDFRTISGCENELTWLTRVSGLLEKEGIATAEQVLNSIDNQKKNGVCIWSDNLGTLLKV